ncbi:IS1595 family transposase [Clostridium sp. YIM B02515]|uniref:IS1595 family transposase n=1 Tax=Clostridium rhizosphaerae TaxID=2803861 RepID=A0ABS1TEK6_9CLOT|nr:IS1595 family transposase [Clostridium rhizosphaerae]MBL4937800.1 IS1595 family transposase [Clostridium rhizosphaerae]
MPSVESIKRDIQTLGTAGQEEILNYLEEVIILGSFATEVTNEIKENRFSRGKVCPHCGHDEVSRNGKYKGNQRYICKSCLKTFTDFTRSPHHNSKKDIKKWILYAKCMINGYSIRKCAKIVDISIPTSFYWRHKILDAIRAYMGIGNVGGVIEIDEAFLRESFKGDHKKSITFTMPRKAHKTGVKGSRNGKTEKLKRGISKEQICVLCAIDRAGNIITELICKGRMKHIDLERLFRDRIDDESILCTDSHKSYIQFAQNSGVELQQIKRGKHKEGIYHIQHINAFHSKLKKWMDRFNGVATKYLTNYMYWFKWLEIFNTEKDTIKSKNLLVQSHTSHSDTKLKDFKIREAIYI